MAVKKTKKKKKGFASRSRGRSTVRPHHVEKMPPCRHICPSGNRVREFLTTIAQAEHLEKSTEQAFQEAWEIYTDTSPFPAVCGRICPHPCEDDCNRREHDGAVNINKVERAIGDFGLENALKLKKLSDETRPEKIAIVGAGPAGISCAYQLARRGYPVTIYEADEKPGGMLLWGVPRFRLPAEVLEGEISKVLELGVELKCNTRVGKDVSLDDLRSQYQTVFVSIGAEKSLKLDIDGEEADNVFSGIELLSRINHGEKIDVGDQVVVLGGSDRAVDVARLCRRLGAEVTLLYRRTREEMPAISREVEAAEAEGVKLECLVAPVGFQQEGRRITTVNCTRMEAGEADDIGKRALTPIEGSEFELPATAVISAISQTPDFTGLEALAEGNDWIVVDSDGVSTKVDGVYAGGDAVSLALVTTAIGQGRKAAEAIDAKLRGVEPPKPSSMPLIQKDRMRFDHYEKKERGGNTTLPVEQRISSMDAEVNLPFSQEQILEETRRCMSCGYCFDCEKCWMYCQEQAFEKPAQKGALYIFKSERCTGCTKCSRECPCGFIDMM